MFKNKGNIYNHTGARTIAQVETPPYPKEAQPSQDHEAGAGSWGWPASQHSPRLPLMSPPNHCPHVFCVPFGCPAGRQWALKSRPEGVLAAGICLHTPPSGSLCLARWPIATLQEWPGGYPERSKAPPTNGVATPPDPSILNNPPMNLVE